MKKYILLLLLILLPAILFATEFANFPKIKGWELKVSDDVYTPENLWDFMNGGADLYNKYGFIELHLADYRSADGMTISAEVYRHSSSVNAYGIYASERSPDYQFLELGGQAYIGDGILNFCSGTYYVKLFADGEGDKAVNALKKVAGSLVEALDQKNSLPELLSVFPKKGKAAYTEKYTAKKYLGHKFLNNAFSAEYEEGYSLFLIQSADAGEIMKTAVAYLKFAKQKTKPVTDSMFVIKDPYSGDIPVVIADRYLIGILNGAESGNAKLGLEKLGDNVKTLGK
ncbi:MAG: hypothetical protein DWQ10_03665 [Calditrichaeota bacterium]|nr:MAG: hypothetical protein DWQ10_03665 [Calditrichota bacterium]